MHGLCLLGLLIGVLGLAGCASDFDTRLENARQLQSTGEFEQAIELLRELLRDRGDDPDANFLLAKALVQTGQTGQAVPALQKAIRSERYAIPAGLLLASTYLRRGAFAEAIDSSERVLAVDPANRTALFARGQSHLALGRPEAALSDADAILARKPEAQNALMLKGGALIALGRRDDAEQIWLDLRTRTAAGDDPNRAARACAQLAFFYRTQEERPRADQTYRECLEHYPTNPYLQHWASDFYLRTDQIDRAIEIHRRAVAAAPENIRSWGRLAEVLFADGQRSAAQKTLEETVERFDSPSAWRLLADFHRKAGHAREARRALEEAIRRTDPPEEVFLFSLGELLVEEGQLTRAREVADELQEPSYRHLLSGAIQLEAGQAEAALAELDAGIALWPENAAAHERAGHAARATGDVERAILEWREALRLAPNATDAAAALAQVFSERGDPKSALEFAELQIARRPSLDPTTHRIAIRAARALGLRDRAAHLGESLGLFHHQRGEYDAAIAAFRAALDNDATLPSLRYRLGLSLIAVGRKNEARSLLGALVQGPEFPEIKAARSELARIRGS